MSKWQFSLEKFRRKVWINNLWVIIPTLFLFTFLMPKNTHFSLGIEKGAKWVLPDLYAAFSFPVNKLPEQIATEKAAISDQLLPVFVRDSIAEKQFWIAFKAITEQLSLDKETCLALEIFIKLQFEQGVFSNADLQLFVNLQCYAVSSIVHSTVLSAQQCLTLQLANENMQRFAQTLALSNNWLIWYQNNFMPNMRYDAILSNTQRANALGGIALHDYMIQKGDLLIKYGDVVNNQLYQVLNSYQEALIGATPPKWMVWSSYLGKWLITCILFFIYIFFIYSFRRDVFDNRFKLAILLANQVLFISLTKLAASYGVDLIYIIPFVLLPIVIRAIFDTGLAIFTHTTTILFASFFAANPSMFLVLQLSAGYTAIFVFVNIRRRSQFILSAGLLLLIYWVGYAGFYLSNAVLGKTFDYVMLLWFFVSAILTLLASPLLLAYEKLFGFVSDVTLMELSDYNNPLLRQLSEKAPGTFQHVLQVANLAEAAIFQTGGNALLVRVGALYHDIGKMKAPQFFIENQHSGGFNPHDELAPEESAKIIIAHVYEGIKLAKAHKLPELIIDFIRTHHGDQRVEFFYRNFMKLNADYVPKHHIFHYPGPKPFSKETAVLMLADSVEAASRALKVYDEASIEALVDNIVADKLKHQQLDRANITLEDIFKIKKIFKEKLKSIYHLRIEYPK